MTEQKRTNCPGYYNVSGYTTKDGKHVDEYVRQCWKHGNENNQNDKEKVNSDTMEKIDDLAQIISFVLKNRHKRNNIPEQNYNPQQFPYITQNENPLQPQPFSTFNPKTTKEKIKDSTKEIENILKQPKISDDEVEKIKDNTKETISNLAKDCEKNVNDRKSQPEIPTWDSVEESKKINKDKEDIQDNAVNSIIMLNLIDNLLDKKFKEKNTDEPNYPYIQQEYIKEKEKNKNLKDIIMNLSYSMRTPNDDTLTWTKRLKEILNQGSTVPKKFDINIASNKIKKIKQLLKNLNWRKLDDLIGAYIYAIYNDKFNSIETVNNLKDKIYKELNISRQEEKLIIEEFNTSDLYQLFNSWNIKNPVTAIILIGWIWWKTNNLLDDFYERPDINITNKELDIKNDMRHITGLAFLTKIFGTDKARKLGYLKEHWDFFSHSDNEDTLIDFDNNEKGIYIAIKYPNLNMREIIQKIYDVYIKNKRNINYK